MANQIFFFTEDTYYKFKNKANSKKWLLSIFKKEGYAVDFTNFIFCSDNYLLEINVKYLNHNTLTDIITFQYNSPGESISSDIYISVDRCAENAIKFNKSFDSELFRLLAHGVLHLCGYKDKNIADKTIMTQKEDYYLSLRT